MEHEWTAQWNPSSAPGTHISTIDIFHRTKIFGFTVVEIQLDVKQIGPAYVELRFKSNNFGGINGVIMQMIKPIAPMRNSIIHKFYLNKSIISFFFSKFLIIGEAKMVY